LTSKIKSKKVYRIYALELTTTEACNFKCSYCFERGTEPSRFDNTYIDTLIDKINKLLDDKWFNENYDGLKLVFWGGEPTLNMDFCERIIKEFEDNERVCFFIYTNGSTMNEFIHILKRVQKKPFIYDDTSKFTVQVSYDGNPINDMCRIVKAQPELSSNVVMRAIDLLTENNIEFGLKATLAWDKFKWLPEVWEDFHQLYNKYGEKIAYSVTVDYYDVQYKKYKEIVDEAILDISRKEISFYRSNGRFLSNIFGNNRAICATGKSMATVATDGLIHYCHGCLYSETYFEYSSIFDDSFIDDIKHAHNFFVENESMPPECDDCPAGTCLRCNVRKHDTSKKELFEDKWFDYTAQDDLCDYYKFVGKVGTAIRLILKEEE
jgi:sulfatase maturation enzyme AslB (radical SAM superfamily)